MKCLLLSIVSFAISLGSVAFAESTTKQQNQAIIQVVNFMDSIRVSPFMISYLDEHQYDGELSSIEYEVKYFLNEKTCTQTIPVPAYPKVAKVKKADVEDPECVDF